MTTTPAAACSSLHGRRWPVPHGAQRPMIAAHSLMTAPNCSDTSALTAVLLSTPHSQAHNEPDIAALTNSSFGPSMMAVNPRIQQMQVLKKSDAAALIDAYNRRASHAGAPPSSGGGGAGLLPRMPPISSPGAPFGGGPSSAAAAARVQASTQVQFLYNYRIYNTSCITHAVLQLT